MNISYRAILIFIVLVNAYACLGGYFFLRSAVRVFAAGLKKAGKILLCVYWPFSLAVSAFYIYSRYSARQMGSLFRLASSYWGLLLFIPFLFLADILNLGVFVFRSRGDSRSRRAVRAGGQEADAVPSKNLRPPPSEKNRKVFDFAVRLAAFVLASLNLVFGVVSARYVKVTDYTVNIEKPLPQNGLKVVFVSDIHIGAMIHKKQLRRLVEKINAQEPDLILIAGDIIDRNLDAYKSENLNEEIGALEARLGVYASPGNHDYFGGDLDELKNLLAAGGVKLLVDEAVLLNGGGGSGAENAFYVIGRHDFSAGRRGAVRKPLLELTKNLDASLPFILMDHQPQKLSEAESAGVDLQVSGHTHRGQIWPGSLVTSRIYELDYGLLYKGKTAFVVSSGGGTWGPSVRIGTRSEIVCIDLKNPPDYKRYNTAGQALHPAACGGLPRKAAVSHRANEYFHP